jgi:hypothetical protein
MGKIRKDQIRELADGCMGILVDVMMYTIHTLFLMWTLGILNRAGWTWLPALGFTDTAIVIGAICIFAVNIRGWWKKGVTK